MLRRQSACGEHLGVAFAYILGNVLEFVDIRVIRLDEDKYRCLFCPSIAAWVIQELVQEEV